MKDRAREIESIRKRWNEHAERYDEWYKTFHGAVEHYVDWELLKGYLPRNKDVKILDAAGGTGRITLPLAKMGYSVTLCDISSGMLNVARRKLRKAGVLDKVKICECDVHKLHFADESFDLVLCWDGMGEAVKELIRVTKKGGTVSIFLVNRYGVAIRKFSEDAASALALFRSKLSYVSDEEEKYKAFSVEEATELFEKEGVKVIEIYAVCGMLDLLSIPKEIQESHSWNEKFFNQVTEMLLRMSKEPSAKGLSKHLVVYGKRI
ncbi:MAG: class I SAM-dependent methyltransferase [Candidatus Bathyarchaeia archaeon]